MTIIILAAAYLLGVVLVGRFLRSNDDNANHERMK